MRDAAVMTVAVAAVAGPGLALYYGHGEVALALAGVFGTLALVLRSRSKREAGGD